MKCDVDYCIYNQEFQLSSLGMCEELIIVSIPENILKKLKERQREDIENR